MGFFSGIFIGALSSCLQSRIRKTQKKRDECGRVSLLDADQELKLRANCASAPFHWN